jgi:Domain of unknown function (DUF1877)
MSGQGYHFAISAAEAEALLRCDDVIAVLDFTSALQESGGACGGYKEWDVLHRVLSDGTFRPGAGSQPLSRCFLGGRLLVTEGSIVNLVLADEVRETAAALSGLGEAWFTLRFFELFSGAAPEADVGWFHGLFEELTGFYKRAAERGLAVVFVTDDCLSYFDNPPTRVYVALLDEGVAVCRPTDAVWQGGDVFRIVQPNGEPEGEQWQFPPGARVRCRRHTFPDGTTALVAFERVED